MSKSISGGVEIINTLSTKNDGDYPLVMAESVGMKDGANAEDVIKNKLNTNQGTENNGKFMKVGADGNLKPEIVPIPDVSAQINTHDKSPTSHNDIRDSVNTLKNDKLDKNQGVNNTGKIITVGDDGNVVTRFPNNVTYNPDTKNLEYGSNDSLPLIDGVKLDTSLTKGGFAADAKITGDKINKIESEATTLKEDLGKLDNTVFASKFENLPIKIKSDGYFLSDGSFRQEKGRYYTIVNVNEKDSYKASFTTRSVIINGITYRDASNHVLKVEVPGTGIEELHSDCLLALPAGTTNVIIQSLAPDTISVKKEKKEFSAYTRAESDLKYEPKKEDTCGKFYGVKWSVTDHKDLGTRCFDAIGLRAEIGKGSVNGYSDFDNVYPWSEMKRCNIKTNANGATIVTFEGEDGFALDGSNGDVFVRIPKFYVQKYIKDGYEYRVISESGATPHEAFIENGIELDEIFIGAFEGYINSGKLESKANVIPTSNEIASTYLSSAKSKGLNYSLYDNRCVDAIWTLMAVEYGCRNSNAIIGYGLADFMQPVDMQILKVVKEEANVNHVFIPKLGPSNSLLMPIGSNITICKGNQLTIMCQRKILNIENVTDSTGEFTKITFDGNSVNVDLTCFVGSAACYTNFCETSKEPLAWHTGRSNFINKSITQNPIRYRWIENVVGNLWHFLPDITFKNSQMYVCKNMKDYEFHSTIGGYKAVADILIENNDNGNKEDVVNANYWITALVNDTFAKGIVFGKAFNKSLTSKDAFGAYYYLDNTEITCIVNGGGFDHLWRCNMLTNRAWENANRRWYLYGARLMFKKVV